MGIVRRRHFLIGTGAMLVASFASFAQVPKTWRIGILGLIPESAAADVLLSFREALRALGYVEGKNAVVDYRVLTNADEKDRRIVSGLVQAKVDIIVAWTTPAALVAQRATSKIPIVMVGVGDPVAVGLVNTLAHPGRNITGLTNLSVNLVAKQVELLRELLPGIRKIGIVRNPNNPAVNLQLGEVKQAIQSVGISSEVLNASVADDFESAFRRLRENNIHAAILLADPSLIANRNEIAESALKLQLVTIFQRRENVEAGGLISYGPDLAEQFRRAAGYVNKILKGVRPSDLPVEQPTKLSLVINARTAKALDLRVPQSIEFRADRLIE